MCYADANYMGFELFVTDCVIKSGCVFVTLYYALPCMHVDLLSNMFNARMLTSHSEHKNSPDVNKCEYCNFVYFIRDGTPSLHALATGVQPW